MRHAKHRHSLGRKKEHRVATMALLAQALFKHGRIKTTVAKAKALRPFAEKIITLAKKSLVAQDLAVKLHYRRLAIAKVRNPEIVKQLFEERAPSFADRNGGYTRIYKLWARIGDAAEMALIELVAADDKGYTKPKSKSKANLKSSMTKAVKKIVDVVSPETSDKSVSEQAEVVEELVEA